MKNTILWSLLLAVMAVGCKEDNLSLKTTDTSQHFIFEAKYPPFKAKRLEKYLDSALQNDLPMDQQVDMFISLNGNEKFNLKAKTGWLHINFEKKNSSINGYLKVKKLTEGIQQKLLEK